jgi:hypothetical protein
MWMPADHEAAIKKQLPSAGVLTLCKRFWWKLHVATIFLLYHALTCLRPFAADASQTSLLRLRTCPKHASIPQTSMITLATWRSNFWNSHKYRVFFDNFFHTSSSSNCAKEAPRGRFTFELGSKTTKLPGLVNVYEKLLNMAQSK